MPYKLLNLPGSWMKVSNAKRQIIFLCVLAFIVRAGFVLTLEERLYWPDEREFNEIALDLLDGKGYQSSTFRANPILPFFLAASYKLFGQHYVAPRLIQSLIGALTVAMLF